MWTTSVHDTKFKFVERELGERHLKVDFMSRQKILNLAAECLPDVKFWNIGNYNFLAAKSFLLACLGTALTPTAYAAVEAWQWELRVMIWKSSTK